MCERGGVVKHRLHPCLSAMSRSMWTWTVCSVGEYGPAANDTMGDATTAMSVDSTRCSALSQNMIVDVGMWRTG